MSSMHTCTRIHARMHVRALPIDEVHAEIELRFGLKRKMKFHNKRMNNLHVIRHWTRLCAARCVRACTYTAKDIAFGTRVLHSVHLDQMVLAKNFQCKHIGILHALNLQR